ncbi:MAG: hypothetical protein J6W64_04125 [Bacilli bacterium]|nr:hypothetical protein [Bacilli bacterium]
MGQMMYHDEENEDGAKKQMALILKASAAEFKDYLKSTYKLDAKVKYEIEIDDEECILIPSSLVVIQSDLDSVSRFVEIMFSAAKKAAMTGKLSGIFENTFMNSILPHVCVLCDQCDGTTWADLADKGVKSTIRDNNGEEYGIVLFKRAK